MRRWLGRIGRVRLRVRTMLGLVAAVALIVVASTRWIPYVRWRLRLERTIDGKVAGDSHIDSLAMSNPSFQLFHGLNDEEIGDFRRDPNFLVDRLLRIVGEEGTTIRRLNTLHSLDMYLDEVEGPELPRRFIARSVRLLASGKLPAILESELAEVLAGRACYVGIDPADREAFRERARVVLGSAGLTWPEVAWNWAGALASLGGRVETEIVVTLVDRWTGPRRDVIFRSGLGTTRRPDLLPKFRGWLDDEVLAREIFLYHRLPRDHPRRSGDPARLRPGHLPAGRTPPVGRTTGSWGPRGPNPAEPSCSVPSMTPADAPGSPPSPASAPTSGRR